MVDRQEKVRRLGYAIGTWMNLHAACLGVTDKGSTVIAVAFDYTKLAEMLMQMIEEGALDG